MGLLCSGHGYFICIIRLLVPIFIFPLFKLKLYMYVYLNSSIYMYLLMAGIIYI